MAWGLRLCTKARSCRQVSTGTGRLVQMNNLQSVAYLPASMLVVRGDATYYRQGWGGSHEFKTGIWAAPKLNRDIVTRYLNDGFVLEEVRQVDPNDATAGTVPFHRRYRTPTEVTTTVARDRDVGLYVQDRWNPNPRVTANVGLRVDVVRRHDAVFNIDRMKSTEVGLRLGVAYQVTKDARTVLRASYGRVAEQVNAVAHYRIRKHGLPRGARYRRHDPAGGHGVTIVTPAATAALSGFGFVEDAPAVRRRLHRWGAATVPRQISVDVSATRRYCTATRWWTSTAYPAGPYCPLAASARWTRTGASSINRPTIRGTRRSLLLEAVVARTCPTTFSCW